MGIRMRDFFFFFFRKSRKEFGLNSFKVEFFYGISCYRLFWPSVDELPPKLPIDFLCRTARTGTKT